MFCLPNTLAARVTIPLAVAVLGPTVAAGTAVASTPPDSAAEAVWPVEVEHAFGTTVIPEEPVRVVSVGIAEQDMILALGVAPVGVSEWYGEQPFATWPWAQDELGDAEPTVLLRDDGLQYERIAALEPDLIVGTNAGLDQEEYDLLSDIAPTIAHGMGAESYAENWDDQTIRIGQALGREPEAEAIVADIRQRFADAAAAHPEFAGTPIYLLQGGFYDGEAIALIAGGGTQFLTDLGFEVPTTINEFVPASDPTQAYIPMENLAVLDDAELLLWGTESADDRAALEAQPLYQQLAAVQAGRLVFTDETLAGAMWFRSPLSWDYVLDEMVPMLAATMADEGPQAAFDADQPDTTEVPTTES
ncbi:MAG: ABC transporter substrate-binding protein [Desertimonas sp.]